MSSGRQSKQAKGNDAPAVRVLSLHSHMMAVARMDPEKYGLRASDPWLLQDSSQGLQPEEQDRTATQAATPIQGVEGLPADPVFVPYTEEDWKGMARVDPDKAAQMNQVWAEAAEDIRKYREGR